MAILFLCPSKDPIPWQHAIARYDPNIEVRVWPEYGDPSDITFALLWNHPRASIKPFQNLMAISSLGAGIDHINNDPAIPKHLPIARIVDPGLVQSMSEYVLMAALQLFRQSKGYERLQQQTEWQPLSPRQIADFPVGIMGMGQLGHDAAKKLSAVGFSVIGWSQSRKDYPALSHSFAGEAELAAFLAATRILVCLLPLTRKTRGILNASLFDKLQHDSYLINVARGAHLVESDLLGALNAGQLKGAYLDVFEEEPLRSDHPFWQHPSITITPHIASITNPQTAAKQIVENYHRAMRGESLLHRVDLEKGY